MSERKFCSWITLTFSCFFKKISRLCPEKKNLLQLYIVFFLLDSLLLHDLLVHYDEEKVLHLSIVLKMLSLHRDVVRLAEHVKAL